MKSKSGIKVSTKNVVKKRIKLNDLNSNKSIRIHKESCNGFYVKGNPYDLNRGGFNNDHKIEK